MAWASGLPRGLANAREQMMSAGLQFQISSERIGLGAQTGRFKSGPCINQSKAVALSSAAQ